METKYRDIADGNSAESANSVYSTKLLETKYRDIADGNSKATPGWHMATRVGNQVPRYSGWKLVELLNGFLIILRLETKYRDIADGNRWQSPWQPGANIRLETKYRDIADRATKQKIRQAQYRAWRI